MKILPSTKRDWLKLFSAIFIGFFFAAGVFLSIWSERGVGLSGMEWRIYRADGLPIFYTGYFISFVGLAVIAAIHLFGRRWRLASWHAVFAILALLAAWILFPLPTK